MKILLVKSMQKLYNPSNSLEQLRTKFQRFLKVFDLFPNVFGVKAIKELTIEQNLLILYGLLRFSMDYAKQIYEKFDYTNQKMMDEYFEHEYSLVNADCYQILEKFNSISLEISKILFDDFGRSVDHFSNVFSDLNIQIKWIEGEETISAWIRISMKKIAQMLAKIGLFIFSNCNNQHLWYFESDSEEIKTCANRINFDELAENFPKKEQKKLFKLLINVSRSEETLNRAKTFEMFRQHSPFDEHILEKIKDYNNIKVSILIGLLQFGRMFTEKFGLFAVKKRLLGLNAEMFWKNITIHINMIDHPGAELKVLEDSLSSAGLI